MVVRRRKKKKKKQERKPVTFPTIIADPPWSYQNFGAKKHGAARGHYDGSGSGFISSIPVDKWARISSNLLLWATNPKLDQAIDVMRAWGFELVTCIPWVKTAPPSAELAKGIGFWHYSTNELLLVCRKGRDTTAPKYKKHEKPDGMLVGEKGECMFYSRRGPHSRKPLPLFEWIESYLPGPYLELFATSSRSGWTCWGKNTGYMLGPKGVTLTEIPRLNGDGYKEEKKR